MKSWRLDNNKALRRRLSEGQNHRCAYCGVAMLSDMSPETRTKWLSSARRSQFWRQMTIDEVVPRAAGGTRRWENCVAACRWCNCFKAHAPADVAAGVIADLVRKGLHPHVRFRDTGRWPGEGYTAPQEHMRSAMPMAEP